MELVMALLDSRLEPQSSNVLLRLAAAITACTQLNTLTTSQRIWALKKLHTLLKSKYAPKPNEESVISILKPLIPGLLKQYEYEEPQVRTGIHLMHSEYFKTLAAVACDMQLDELLPPGTDTNTKWAWFRRYCSAVRVAQALTNRTALPRPFIYEVRKKLMEMCSTPSAPTSASSSFATAKNSLSGSANSLTGAASVSGHIVQFIDSISLTLNADCDRSTKEVGDPQYHEDHNIFRAQHDRQLLQWLNRRYICENCYLYYLKLIS